MTQEPIRHHTKNRRPSKGSCGSVFLGPEVPSINFIKTPFCLIIQLALLTELFFQMPQHPEGKLDRCARFCRLSACRCESIPKRSGFLPHIFGRLLGRSTIFPYTHPLLVGFSRVLRYNLHSIRQGSKLLTHATLLSVRERRVITC